MQNQAAVEALYSATFVEDYLDCVENLPSDLQRHLSRLREFDLIQYSEFLKDLDSLVVAFEKETTASGQRNVLSKIQHGLIAAQDIGDDKLITVQAMSDLIENKSRQLEHDSKILDFGKDDDDETTVQTATTKKPETGNSNQTTPAANTSNTTKNTPTSKPPKEKDAKESGGRGQVKKPRNKKPEVTRSRVSAGGEDREDDEESNKSNRSGNAASRGPRGGSAGRKRQAGASVQKRQSGKRSNTFPSNKNDDDSDREVDPSTFDIDPDEPRYCLCDQVSYGEMIGCDNDLCPIEWFHFGCMGLTAKPKGKWYCPKCRGDKQTIMKPRAQFLKELAKFNQEREAKMMKQTTPHVCFSHKRKSTLGKRTPLWLLWCYFRWTRSHCYSA